MRPKTCGCGIWARLGFGHVFGHPFRHGPVLYGGTQAATRNARYRTLESTPWTASEEAWIYPQLVGEPASDWSGVAVGGGFSIAGDQEDAPWFCDIG